MPPKPVALFSEFQTHIQGSQFQPVRPKWKLGTLNCFTNVNFDDLPSGTAIAANHYAGVNFSTVVPGGRPVNVVNWPQLAKSQPNVVTLTAANVLPAFDARDGAIKAQFDALQMTVSIDALPLVTPETLGMAVTNRPLLEAYGDGDKFLGKVFYPLAYGTPGYGSWQTLSFSTTAASIRYVLFSSQYTGAPAVWGVFDNLYFQVTIPILIPTK
jgi:hypothetical protein